MASYITDDFRPHPRVYKSLAKHGCVREFCDDEHDSFMLYWQTKRDKKVKGGLKESWDKTYFNWMRTAWNGKAGRDWERTRHYRTRAPAAGPREDLFENVLAGVKGEEKPKPKKVQAPRPPIDYPLPKEDGPKMNPEEAFEQLRKMGVI